MRKPIVWAAAAALALTVTAALGAKLKLEEVIAEHRGAVASEQVLANLQSIAATGTGKLELIVGGSGYLEGPALLGSEPDQLAFLINFAQANYHFENYIYDDDEISVAFTSPGQRSPLGDFIFTHDYALKEGLFGGTLSARWPLYQEDLRDAKLNYRGVKKVEGAQLHEIEYRRRKGGQDSKIKIHLDEESFLHRRTEYGFSIAASIARTPQESARQQKTYVKLVETFDNHMSVDGVTLPTLWTLHYSVEGTNQSLLWKWTVDVDSLQPNGHVDPKYFELQTAGR